MDGNFIHNMDDTTSAIKNFPHRRTVDNVRSFLGLCGYYRSFISGFAKIVHHLIQLLKKEMPFIRNAAQEKTFNDLKSTLINAPCLAFPDYNIPFVLCTNASALVLGAVLLQPDARGKNLAIA